MKINMKVRFKNATFVVTFLTVIVSFIYSMLGVFGVVPAVAEDMITQAIVILVEIMAGFGVLTDPTTKGVSDSERAMRYDVPGGDNTEDKV